VSTEGLELKIVKRGAPPLGGGEVVLKVPVVGATIQVSRLFSLLTHLF
jgi:RNA 3'-terminal phosphate cyclase